VVVVVVAVAAIAANFLACWLNLPVGQGFVVIALSLMALAGTG